MQKKTHSLIESFANVIIGYLIAVLSQIAIFPLFGMKVSLQNNFLIGLWFTLISIIRSYTLRRLFTRYINNWLTKNK